MMPKNHWVVAVALSRAKYAGIRQFGASTFKKKYLQCLVLGQSHFYTFANEKR